MLDLVKSKIDGNWYYKDTHWDLAHECLCDALSMFSEDDKSSEIYISISHLCDEIYAKYINLIK